MTVKLIPDSVISIGDYAFESCTSLEIIAIPDSVMSIRNSAFYYCTALESITIPDSVANIEGLAFSGCTSLGSITIENPDCTIFDSEYTVSDTAKNYGYENSTAQAYAEKYNREFISLCEPAVIKGDANNDGEIGVADIVLLQRYLINIEVNVNPESSGINSDGKLNVFDLILLKRIVMNI